MTFVVARLRARGLGSGAEAAFFVVLGLASAAGTLTVWAGSPAGCGAARPSR